MRAKRIISLIITGTILGTIMPNIVFATEGNNESEAIEYIIKYDVQSMSSAPVLYSDTVDTVEITNSDIEVVIEDSLTSATDVAITDEIINSESESIKLVSVTTADSKATLSELSTIDGVVFAEPNYKIKALANDPGYNNQWGLTSNNGINTEKAWEVTKGSGDITVAILDTGVDINHQDLSANIFINAAEVSDGVDNDGNGYIDDINGWDFTTYESTTNNGDNSVYDGTIIDGENTDAHGTHIAGIIAASLNGTGVQGVAPNTKILPVKFMNNGEGTVFNAIKAIEYAETMGAKIANCSWGAEGYSHFLHDSIANSSMFFVCAAGNEESNVQTYPEYPAMFDLDNIISVGATSSDGSLAYFSNYGQGVDVAAPGEEIYSTLPENTYGYMDGTSMATPFVSGAAALLLSISDNLSSAQMREMIIDTVAENTALSGKVDSSGIIDVGKLVKTNVSLSNLLSERYGAESVISGSDLYTIGGINSGQYNKYIEKYVPETQMWEQIAEIPVPVADSSVAAYENKIYIIGGYNGEVRSDVQIYNLSDNTWQTGISMSEALYGSAYVQSNNKLYIFGGIGADNYKNKIYEYDMSTDVWTEKNNLPVNMAYSSAVNANGVIYLMGGCNSKGCFDTIYTYNTENDSISNVTSMSESKKDFASVCINDKIYIFGGSKSYNSLNKNALLDYNRSENLYSEVLSGAVEVFDTTMRICTKEDELSKALIGMSAVNYFNNIYLLGGWSGVTENEVFKYEGVDYPRNIKVSSSGNTLSVEWGKVPEAVGYNIEINGTIYYTTDTSYSMTVDESIEHKIRVQSIKQSISSLWSDYIYYFMHSTITDAKVIATTSSTTDKLYKTGQIKWYKLNNGEAGSITIELANVPESCNYVVQLCSSGGDIIATGEESGNSIVINNVVLSPYAYYIKIFSVHGGDTDSSYTLNCSFVSASDSALPDRVKTSVLSPSSLDGQSLDGVASEEITDENSDEVPEETVELKEVRVSASSSESSCGTQPYIEEILEEQSDENNMVSLSGLKSESTKTGQLSSKGSTYSGSVTVPAKTPGNSQKCKVVVVVIPENEYDEMSIAWTGTNTDYNNFWYHYSTYGEYDDKYIYYLTAILGSSTSDKTYNYKVTCDYKSSSSAGNYTIKTYILVDSEDEEDYDNAACGNETPKYAGAANPSTNSSKTITGKIDHPYDRDFYYVEASSSEKVTAYLESPTGTQYFVSIYDNRCTTNSYNKNELMDGWTNDGISYASICGQTSTSQKYCIKVCSDDGTFSPDNTYTLKIYKYSLSKLGDLELNDSFENADNLENTVTDYIGTTTKTATPIKFSIDSPVDVDNYAVYLKKGDKISIKMDLPTSYNDFTEQYRIEIYSDVEETEDGITYMVRSFNNPKSTYSKFVTFIADSSGTYYVGVKSLERKFNYSKYGTLMITKTASSSLDKYEDQGWEDSNDFICVITSLLGIMPLERITAELIDVNVSNATIDNELDIDWYNYKNGAEHKTAEIQVSGADGLEVIVLDSERNLLSAGVNGNTYTFAPNGTYYIAVYAADNSYGSMLNNNSYTLDIELEKMRSDLIFKPVNWGAFIYDNNPEYLKEEDLADYDLGNSFIMSADNVSGYVDFQSSHSVLKYVLDKGPVSFDVLLYNPLSEPVTVEVERVGYQAPYEVAGDGSTSDEWACLQAWADFMQFHIEREMIIGERESEYNPYNYKDIKGSMTQGGRITLEGGESKWLFGDNACLTMNQSTWSPFNIVTRLKITGGVVNLGFAAFRNRNNVFAPESAKLFYSESQRNYTEAQLFCKHICECDNCVYDARKGECKCVECADWECNTYCKNVCIVEHDIDGKPKGVTPSVAETKTNLNWVIDDQTQYFTPMVYNMSNPNGYMINSDSDYRWYTHYNPNADKYDGKDFGVENDILELTFDEKNVSGDILKTWVFNTRRTKPSLDNSVFKENKNNDEETERQRMVNELMPLGNYGVAEKYIMNIENTTSVSKTITYSLQTESHAIISYRDNKGDWKRKIKASDTKAEGETQEEFERSITEDIFSIDISPGEEKTLEFEVILPNADPGGFKHQLRCE